MILPPPPPHPTTQALSLLASLWSHWVHPVLCLLSASRGDSTSQHLQGDQNCRSSCTFEGLSRPFWKLPSVGVFSAGHQWRCVENTGLNCGTRRGFQKPFLGKLPLLLPPTPSEVPVPHLCPPLPRRASPARSASPAVPRARPHALSPSRAWPRWAVGLREVQGKVHRRRLQEVGQRGPKSRSAGRPAGLGPGARSQLSFKSHDFSGGRQCPRL